MSSTIPLPPCEQLCSRSCSIKQQLRNKQQLSHRDGVGSFISGANTIREVCSIFCNWNKYKNARSSPPGWSLLMVSNNANGYVCVCLLLQCWVRTMCPAERKRGPNTPAAAGLCTHAHKHLSLSPSLSHSHTHSLLDMHFTKLHSFLSPPRISARFGLRRAQGVMSGRPRGMRALIQLSITLSPSGLSSNSSSSLALLRKSSHSCCALYSCASGICSKALVFVCLFIT